jgi:hypothetical protein
MSLSPSLIRRLSDSEDSGSLGNRLRSRRFRQFEARMELLPKPVRLLDVGGDNSFWEQRGWAGKDGVQIVTLNIAAEPKRHANIEPMVGDATDLSQFSDASFDVVFSNSVIEHLFTFDNQRRMASEVARVGKALWVQTPNYWFPIEPHFQVPGWQWMPVGMRVSMLRRWRCGWRGPCPDRERAQQLVSEIRLLRQRELQAMFPRAVLVPERFCGLIKSWTAVQGFPPALSV